MTIWLDYSQCCKAFAVFSHHLDRAVCGNCANRFGKRVKVIPVVEKSDLGREGTFTRLLKSRAHIDPVAFDELVRKCWSKVDWAHDRVELKDDADFGWLKYMLKPRQKAGLENWSDCIVWELLHNPIADA